MSELTTLARPYAVAVFKAAKEAGNIQEWADMLEFLKQVMADPLMQRAASDPKAGKDRFIAKFLDLCKGHVIPEGENFIRLLASNGRLGLVGTIADMFAEFRAEEEGYVDVDVITAYPLEESETTNLNALVEKWMSRKGRLHVTVDESLIAGVVLRAGGRVVDASVHGQLQRLAKRLSN
ncbi:ATP synthase F1, delta subunit [Methylococcus capsulatus str. Bath]|uniref:ATP synthase subunit delta n=1 Tax=Methylococcus capsulatus (strain ATCC 33009 / NCIMB 11132 / Bath) TaxID=243233 RepID=ATPD_METCA|nr:F0F1 ATP synthase subunit delta [Methylococcus capsulatus]Q60CR7.1 RecName: Full=ATP synthase subunit delta; AltName: Full=ATP synthase F(1) sector subunit delta; AltName: Full=F-type ATPase subunit delta; Short=F-ATPase subunit delta [Methylococcus capsulatus str. Bath]AAU90746.1 ATP synthase F1, delta subunit [Methylococcus capsulatus str. Bath]UQN11428.1 F0F1 ATP synthase subunit delta [Methylococcus capsulatus]